MAVNSTRVINVTVINRQWTKCQNFEALPIKQKPTKYLKYETC